VSDELIACVCTRAPDLWSRHVFFGLIPTLLSCSPSDLTCSPSCPLPLLTLNTYYQKGKESMQISFTSFRALHTLQIQVTKSICHLQYGCSKAIIYIVNQLYQLRFLFRRESHSNNYFEIFFICIQTSFSHPEFQHAILFLYVLVPLHLYFLVILCNLI
jgi:hypothetical protein